MAVSLNWDEEKPATAGFGYLFALWVLFSVQWNDLFIFIGLFFLYIMFLLLLGGGAGVEGNAPRRMFKLLSENSDPT